MSWSDNEGFLREKQQGNMVRTRLSMILIGFSILFSAVAVRAADVMLIGVPEAKQNTASGSSQNYERTEIVDRNGNLIATNLRTASVYANPKEILNLEDTVVSLTTALPDLDPTDIIGALTRDTRFVWIKRNITPQEQKRVNNKGLPGIYFIDDKTRVYPHGNLFSHVVGYVNIDNKGLAGIERAYDEYLNWGQGVEPLELSINIKLQHILRDELSKKMREYEAKAASGMIVDVNTGEVLSMVSLPDYDPNLPSDAGKEQKFNRLTLGVYEMGSTFKTFTTAMALDYGTARKSSKYDVTRPLEIAGHKISDYHGKERILSLKEVMMYSSNIGSAQMAIDVGPKKHKEFFQKIGLLDKIEIELSEKAKPLIPRRWRDVNSATISFGHGIAVTPAHVMRAFLPMVNGGKHIPITLVKKKPGDFINSKQVISKKTSDQVRGLLRSVVAEGTGRNANVPGYEVGGKTGTAEKHKEGGYDTDSLLSSFIAAFPMNDPQYAVLAVFDEPQEQRQWARPTGGLVAAPTVKNIISRIAPALSMRPVDKKQSSRKKDNYVRNLTFRNGHAQTRRSVN